jgi:putative serine protease PepD
VSQNHDGPTPEASAGQSPAGQALPPPGPPRPPQFEPAAAPVGATSADSAAAGGVDPGGPAAADPAAADPAAGWPPPRNAPYPGQAPAGGQPFATASLADPTGPLRTHDTTVLLDPQQPAAPGPATKRGGFPLGLAAGGLAVALVAGLAGGAAGYTLARQDSGSGIVAAPSEPGDASPPAAGSIAAIAAAAIPAVVNIEAGTGITGGGTGSGFIISGDGTIVTNNHVIAGARQITVNFADGTSAPAELVGADAGYDLAVLDVDKTDLPVLRLGSSAAVQVGDSAIAVGSPLGLSGTVTSGIISALNRPVTTGDQDTESFINAIQTDAAINPGNSGGPLLNGAGEVIGVNSAIASLGTAAGGQSGSIGLGFSIPIDISKRIVDEILRTGSAQTPIIGVQIEDSREGPRVAEVAPGGPAERAGVEQGDIVTAVDGRRIDNSTGLIVAVRAKAVGDTVTLTVERDGQTLEIPVVLEAK